MNGSGIDPDIEKNRCGNCIGCFRTTNCEKCANCDKKISPCLRRICVESDASPVQARGNHKTPVKKEKKGKAKKAPLKKNKVLKVKKSPVKSPVKKLTKREKRQSISQLFEMEPRDEFLEPKEEPISSCNSSPVKFSEHTVKVEVKQEPKENENIDINQEIKQEERTLSQSDTSSQTGQVKQRKPHKPHKPHVWKTKEQRLALKLLKEKQEELEMRQCLGPGCVKFASPSSKYCSEECGMAQAKIRLCRILPQRVADFYGEKPLSELEADIKIQQLTKKKAEIENGLSLADSYTKNLDLYLSVLSQGSTVVVPSSSNQEKEEDEVSFPHSCFICGSDVSVRSLPKHIQKCFVRMEKQTTFGTKSKFSYNPNNILCETFDKTTQTFCKRLRVMCSDHYKDEIGSGMKVCGYPIVWSQSHSMEMKDMFGNLESILSEGMCFAERRQCDKHYLWEQTAYAIIDNDRMSLLLQLDEITEHYRRLAEVYRTRGDAVTLLLNWRERGHGKARDDCTQLQLDAQVERMIREYQRANDLKANSTVPKPHDPTKPRRGRPPGQRRIQPNTRVPVSPQRPFNVSQIPQVRTSYTNSPLQASTSAHQMSMNPSSSRQIPQPSRFVVRQPAQSTQDGRNYEKSYTTRPQLRYGTVSRTVSTIPQRDVRRNNVNNMTRTYEIRRDRSQSPSEHQTQVTVLEINPKKLERKLVIQPKVVYEQQEKERLDQKDEHLRYVTETEPRYQPEILQYEGQVQYQEEVLSSYEESQNNSQGAAERPGRNYAETRQTSSLTCNERFSSDNIDVDDEYVQQIGHEEEVQEQYEEEVVTEYVQEQYYDENESYEERVEEVQVQYQEWTEEQIQEVNGQEEEQIQHENPVEQPVEHPEPLEIPQTFENVPEIPSNNHVQGAPQENST